MFFDRLKIMACLDKFQKASDPSSQNEVLSKILGFLRKETCTAPAEIEKKLMQRISELENMNADLVQSNQQYEFKNIMLQDQIKHLDSKIFDIGQKVSSAEVRQQIAYEEQRKAMHELKIISALNANFESMIETHEREKQSLVNDLKKYTRSKIRSNIYQAEIYRKEQQISVVQRSQQALRQIFCGVEAQKATQTAIVGIKGHVIHLNEKQYQEKFCKVFAEAEA